MRVGVSLTDLSGEHHAALLLEHLGEELNEGGEDLEVFGLGSARLREFDAELFEDIAGLGTMGSVTSLLSVGKMLLSRKKTPSALVKDFVRFLLSRAPDVVILVDSRVMNLAVAKELRERGYEGVIVYHVAPVRWESCFDGEFFDATANLARFEAIKPYVDFFFLIYPVSIEAYEKLEMPHRFIGHPMAELASLTMSREKFAGITSTSPPLPPGKHWISLFPGSRWDEVRSITPTLLKSTRILADNYHDVHFILPVAHEIFRSHIESLVKKEGVEEVTSLTGHESVPDVICMSRLVIAKSGTVLHLATLAGVPMVMVYDVSPVQRWVVEKVMDFSFPFYAFPNLIAGKEVVPELIKDKFSATAISIEASRLLYDGDRREKMTAELKELSKKLTKEELLKYAAGKIIELVRPARVP